MNRRSAANIRAGLSFARAGWPLKVSDHWPAITRHAHRRETLNMACSGRKPRLVYAPMHATRPKPNNHGDNMNMDQQAKALDARHHAVQNARAILNDADGWADMEDTLTLAHYLLTGQVGPVETPRFAGGGVRPHGGEFSRGGVEPQADKEDTSTFQDIDGEPIGGKITLTPSKDGRFQGRTAGGFLPPSGRTETLPAFMASLAAPYSPPVNGKAGEGREAATHEAKQRRLNDLQRLLYRIPHKDRTREVIAAVTHAALEGMTHHLTVDTTSIVIHWAGDPIAIQRSNTP